MKKILTFTSLSLLLFACSENKDSDLNQNNSSIHSEVKDRVQAPAFQEDLAYGNIETQVNFGPRVPLSAAHKSCKDWLLEQLIANCDTVYQQNVRVTTGDQKNMPCYNMIGVINPKATKRILLLAHWDTRPWADQEHPESKDPILGADDGASGVGVLIELSRVLKENPLPNKEVGIDILLVDMEDYGKSEWGDDSYALGAQYWAKNPHVDNYKAEAGILLDMVGGKNARFGHEGFSKQYAGYVLKQVWAAAARAGYSSYFVNEESGTITDDHVPINLAKRAPTIDIINLPRNSRTGFVPYWHTQNDNMENIDKNTLKAVGQTLLEYLYNY